MLFEYQPFDAKPIELNMRRPREDGKQRLYIVDHPESADEESLVWQGPLSAFQIQDQFEFEDALPSGTYGVIR